MSLGRHTTYNLIGASVPLVISIVTVPLYMHIIGPDRYGVLAICWGLLGYFGMFDLGLGRAVSYRLSVLRDGTPQERADAAWTAVIVAGTMGLIGAAIFWVAAGFFFSHSMKASEGIRTEILQAMPLLIFAVPIAVITAVLTGAMQGRQQFLKYNFVNVTSSSLSQLLPLLLAVVFAPHLPIVLIGAICARLVGALAFAVLCHFELWKDTKPRVLASEAKMLLKFGGWVTVNGVLAPVMLMADRLVIGALIGTRAVAAYMIPFSMAERISILPYAFTNALFPKMSAEASPEERERMGDDALKVLIAVMTPPILIGIVLAEPLMKLWLGSTYDERSGGVARVLLINFWTASFGLIPHVRLQASGRPNVLTVVLLWQIPFFLAGLYFGITWLGVVGAAWTLLGRSIAHYMQTSWAANRRFVGWPILVLNLTVLLIAQLACDFWGITEWRLWVLTAGLFLICAISTWRNLPDHAKQFCRRILEPIWRTAQ